MFVTVRRSSKDFLWRMFAREEGGVLPMFALAVIPVVSLIGVGVDYSRVNSTRAALQTSLDTALLAGAKDGTTQWNVTALNIFNANFNAANITASPAFALTADRAYTGNATASVPTEFLHLLGISSVTVAVQATATMVSSSSSTNHYCIMALNQSAQGALQLSGNASITISAPQCVLQVNSSNLSAVTMSGNSTISSAENCFVGGMQRSGNAAISPAPDKSCSTIPDPFTNYPRPAFGTCSYTNYQASGNQSVTLQPGVYCGGMSFSGNVSVTFSPGLYVIQDGKITESGGNFTGNGVTIFLTGTGAAIQMSGNADWHLVAPLAGATGMPGFAIFLDPKGPTGLPASSSQLSGNAELYFEGIVYLPAQKVSVTGNAQQISPSPYTSYIADTLTFTGNAQLVINNDLTKTQVPIPQALMVQTNATPVLSQ